MNLARRIVASLALAAALAIMAAACVDVVVGDVQGGWFMYQPNANALISPTSTNGAAITAALIRLTAVAVWFACSWRLFRPHDD